MFHGTSVLLCAQVSVCKMRRSKAGSYVRDGMSVEVMVKSSDNYEGLIAQGLDLDTVQGSSLKLFSMSGAMIPDVSSWTLGDYLQRVKKGEVKLGIGLVEVILVNMHGL